VHVRELDELLSDAAFRVADAAFHMLYADRPFLYAFQLLVSRRVRQIDLSAYPEVFLRPGVLRRPNSLPAWVKRAVFHRDRGRCQRCATDLTGVAITNETIRIDHIVPLAESGTNDPTNFQLLCEKCNLDKAASIGFDEQRVHTYW